MPFMKAEHLSLVSITYYSKMPGDSSLIGLRCAVKMFLFSLAQGWLMLLNLSRPTYIIYLNSLFYYGHQWYLPQNKEMYVSMPFFTLMCKSIFRPKSFIFSCTILQEIRFPKYFLFVNLRWMKPEAHIQVSQIFQKMMGNSNMNELVKHTWLIFLHFIFSHVLMVNNNEYAQEPNHDPLL